MHPAMLEFSATAWLGIAAVAGLGVLAMLNAAASVIRNQTYVHDTRVRVNTLRCDYLRRVDEEDRDGDDIIEVSPESPASAPSKAA